MFLVAFFIMTLKRNTGRATGKSGRGGNYVTIVLMSKIKFSRAVVAHAFNPSTLEAEAGGPL